MRILDLFSGIGGFSLAGEWAGYETVAFCEIEPFAKKILKKNFPNVPIFDDIRKLNRSDINGAVDVITGGFPCQPFSVAGRKKGTQDDRDLWPQMFRVIKEFKPTWVVGENVANFVSMAFQRTKTDLESEGYEVQPFIIPACGVGARHRRDRVWIVGYSNHNGSFTTEEQRGFDKASDNNNERKKKAFQLKRAGRQGNDDDLAYSDRDRRSKGNWSNIGINKTGEDTHRERATDTDNARCSSAAMANTDSIRQSRQGEFIRPLCKKKDRERKANRTDYSRQEDQDWWKFEPSVGRVAHGVSNRVDRLKGLGNAIVPQVAYQILKAIKESEK